MHTLPDCTHSVQVQYCNVVTLLGPRNCAGVTWAIYFIVDTLSGLKIPLFVGIFNYLSSIEYILHVLLSYRKRCVYCDFINRNCVMKDII
jgi:hypothetical protein